MLQNLSYLPTIFNHKRFRLYVHVMQYVCYFRWQNTSRLLVIRKFWTSLEMFWHHMSLDTKHHKQHNHSYLEEPGHPIDQDKL